MYLTRTIEPVIEKMTAHFPALLVAGARQVGKTTLLRALSNGERQYISLDDPRVLTVYIPR